MCLTGHRIQSFSSRARGWTQASLDNVAVRLHDEYGTTTAVSGMAIGSDLWWAASALRAGLTLHAVIPFPQQAARWSPADRRDWEMLREAAHHVTVLGPEFSLRLLHQRNHVMIAMADAAVAVWKPGKTTGGTYAALRKMNAGNMPGVWINPKDFTVSGGLPSTT